MSQALSTLIKASLAMILMLSFAACTPEDRDSGFHLGGNGDSSNKTLSPEIEKLVLQADEMQEEINRGILARDISDRDKGQLVKLMYRLKVDLMRLDEHPNETEVIKDLYRTLQAIKALHVVKRDRTRIEGFTNEVGEIVAKAAKKNSVQVEGLTWPLFSTEFSNDVAPFLSWNSEWKTDWTQKDTSYVAVSGFRKKAWLLTPGINLTGIQEPAFRIKHTVVINRNNNNPEERFDREEILRKAFKVLISTDYDGKGDPDKIDEVTKKPAYQWRRLDISPMPLSADFNFVVSPEVSLAKYGSQKVTIAFVFDMAAELGQHYITWQIQRFDLLGRGELPKLDLYPGPLLDLKFAAGKLDPFQQFEVVPDGVSWEYTGKPRPFAKISTVAGKPTENWLLSPKIQIRDQQDLKLTIKETVNTPEFKNFRIWISKDYNGGAPSAATWVPIERTNAPTPADGQWTDMTQGPYDLSDYANSDITVGFQFINDGSEARRTWEIEALQFNGKGDKIGVDSGSAQ